jgi:beta-lactam-binding protein with PASTA domain
VLDSTSNQPQGTVISQSLVKGSLIQPGETVTITVSNGPQMVAIPYVIGMTVSAARRTLEAAGLKAVVSTGPDFFGLVYDESPNAFTSVPAGTSILLNVNPVAGGGDGGNGGGGTGTPWGGLG